MCEPCFYLPVFYCLLSHQLCKGKVSTAAVTLGNTCQLPVQVAHIRPLCYRCCELPSTPASNSTMQSVMLSLCLAILFYMYYLLFLVWPMYQIVVISLGRKKKKKKKKKDNRIFMNVNGGCGRSPWQISVLWCRLGPWEAYGCMCDSPALSSSHDLYCMAFSSYWVVLQENVCHQPLNMCLNDISPVCLWECLCPQAEYVFLRRQREITKMRPVRFSRCKNVLFSRLKL